MLRRARRSISARAFAFFASSSGEPAIAVIDLKTIFLPNRYATPDQFWLALGVVALIDGVRVSIMPVGALLTWLLVVFFTACVFINRLRDAGRPGPLVIAPLGLATLAKSVAAMFVIAAHFAAFLAAQGVDVNDRERLEQALEDPQYMQTYQQALSENPELAVEILRAAAWPSVLAFWLVLFALGIWFARMRPKPARPARRPCSTAAKRAPALGTSFSPQALSSKADPD